jgi:hypothetical protein
LQSFQKRKKAMVNLSQSLDTIDVSPHLNLIENFQNSFSIENQFVSNGVLGEGERGLGKDWGITAATAISAGLKPTSRSYELHLAERSDPKGNLYLQRLFKQKICKELLSKTEKSCGNKLGSYVSIVDKGNGRVVFSNVVRCGSRFCPNCSGLLAEEKKTEANFILGVLNKKFRVYGLSINLPKNVQFGFLTLTIPHKMWSVLSDLMGSAEYSEGLRGAFKKFYKAPIFGKKGKIKGWIRALEVTHSPENGFHPHIHVLLVFDGDDDINFEEIEKKLLHHWRVATTSSGFGYLDGVHGLDLKECGTRRKDTAAIANYLTEQDKWDISSEMTAINKRGRGSSLSMNQIQRLVARGMATPLEFMAIQEYISFFKNYKVQTIGYGGICRPIKQLYGKKVYRDSYKHECGIPSVEDERIVATMSWELFRRIIYCDGFKSLNRMYMEGFDLQSINSHLIAKYDEGFQRILAVD